MTFADAAVNGTVGAPGLVLFGIVFFWQPPHVWAIALYRKADYEAAGIPMLPSVIGDQPTRRRMLLCTIGLVPVTPDAMEYAVAHVGDIKA